jgi:hypothetical protein
MVLTATNARSEHQVTAITSRLRNARRALRPAELDRPHFHVDADGRPFVCDFARCESPGLTVAEASRSRTGSASRHPRR